MTQEELDSLVEQYKNLLIVQYYDKEKARATIGLFVETLLQNGITFDVKDAFDINTAIGNQLDVLGKYIGLDRIFPNTGIGPGDFFTMGDYNDSGISGFSMGDYGDLPGSSGDMAGYEDMTAQSALSDDDYRILLKFKIIQNHSNHSLKSINDNLFLTFGTDIYASSLDDMTITYTFVPGIQDIVFIAFEKDAITKPMAVGVNYIIKSAEKMFAFTSYNNTLISDSVTGFTTYADFDTSTAETLTYDKTGRL